ncbi:MAG: nucleotidyltransferase domain-containing protein [Nanoarchaeota archaeon]|nr:nucleotidyltransferase domain-containing protein [Nanoarchaeota archaeon]
MVNITSLTKAEITIISFFIGNIKKEFGIREISRNIKTDYKNTYSTIQKLAKKGVLLKRRKANIDLCSLNLKGDSGEICFVEAMKARNFMEKHRVIKDFFNAVMDKTRHIYYSLIIFGSFAKGKETKSSDLDILVIAPEKSIADEIERIINTEAVTVSAGIHSIAISESDFIANLADKKPNVITEAFKSHIIITGSEPFYQGVKKAL